MNVTLDGFMLEMGNAARRIFRLTAAWKTLHATKAIGVVAIGGNAATASKPGIAGKTTNAQPTATSRQQPNLVLALNLGLADYGRIVLEELKQGHAVI